MPYTALLKDEVDSLNTTKVFYIAGKYFFCSAGPKLKISKEPSILYFATASLGSSQSRFQYQSFKVHLIWNQNGTEMEPI